MKQVLVALLLASMPAISADEPDPFSGKWKVHTNIQGYEFDMDCTFAVKEGEITGTCKGEGPELSIKGKVEGKKLSWQYNTEYNGDALTVTMTGALETDAKITGTADVQPMGASGEFSATQVKPSA